MYAGSTLLPPKTRPLHRTSCRQRRDRPKGKRRADRARYAHFDALTGLANAAAWLGQAITSVHQHQHPLAVLFVDLDKFKTIQRHLALGHAVGGVVLREEVAGRLSDFAGPDDILARLGRRRIPAGAARCRRARRLRSRSLLLTAMSVPVRVDGRELSTTPTIGVSLYPRDGEEADDLIRNADISCTQAKARGRNTFQLYTPDILKN